MESFLIEDRIINSIREIRKNKKGPDKNSICLYMEKKFDETRGVIENVIEQMVEEGTLLCRIYDENRESYFVSENILDNDTEQLGDKFRDLSLKDLSPASTLASSFFEGANKSNVNDLSNTQSDLSNTQSEIDQNMNKRMDFLTNLVFEQ